MATKLDKEVTSDREIYTILNNPLIVWTRQFTWQMKNLPFHEACGHKTRQDGSLWFTWSF